MWGEVIIGGFSFRETIRAEQVGERITIDGQDSYPPQPRAAVRAAHDAVIGLLGLTVPVEFTDKDQLTGFYVVSGARSDYVDKANGEVLTATWQLVLDRIGGPRDVEVESYVPRIGRQTALAVVPTFWHAPASGVTDYFTGSTVPAYTVIREGRDGNVAVHTGLPAGTEPRWSVTPDKYMNAAAVLRLDGRRRIGLVTPPDISSWEVENGLVRMTDHPTLPGRVQVECWDPELNAWSSATAWEFRSSTSLTMAAELTVIRNEPEEVVVRLTYPQSLGRVTVDLGLRRGSRFVTGVIKRHSAATLGVGNDIGGGAAVAGGLRKTAVDTAGNRWIAGSAINGLSNDAFAISKAALTRFDFFIGHEVGNPAAEGDDFADLLAQYIGSTGEETRVVLR